MLSKIRNHWDDIIERLFTEYEYARATLDTFLSPCKVAAVDESAHTVTILAEKQFVGFNE